MSESEGARGGVGSQCDICEGVGTYDEYKRVMGRGLPYEHGYCKGLLCSDMSTIDAAEKLNSLQLPKVFVPYSLVTIAVKEGEGEKTILSNICKKMKEELRNVGDTIYVSRLTEDKLSIDYQKLTCITEKKAKQFIANMFFYNRFKYICVNNRNGERGKRDVDPEYQDACRIVYYALDLNKKSNTLKDQCLHLLKEVKADSASDAERSSKESSGPEGVDKSLKRRVTSVGSEESSPPKKIKALEIPRELAKELEGVRYFYGNGLCVGDDTLASDDTVIAINQSYGMAVGVYALYSRYYG